MCVDLSLFISQKSGVVQVELNSFQFSKMFAGLEVSINVQPRINDPEFRCFLNITLKYLNIYSIFSIFYSQFKNNLTYTKKERKKERKKRKEEKNHE